MKYVKGNDCQPRTPPDLLQSFWGLNVFYMLYHEIIVIWLYVDKPELDISAIITVRVT